MIYSLTNGEATSDSYYYNLKIVTEVFVKEAYPIASNYVEQFMRYIKKQKIEELRSKKEYFIEFIMINVFINDYKSKLKVWHVLLFPCFFMLNKLRRGKLKKVSDKMRGILNYHILYKVHKKSLKIKNINNLLIWLSECGDFKEEVLRMKSWNKFLKGQNNFENFIITGERCFKILNEVGDKYLKNYVKNIGEYLNTFEKDHYEKEDIIYCSKSISQYYFNMICSEIMNNVYKEAFLSRIKKYVFVPACMRINQNGCKAEKKSNGYICSACSNNCNVNELTRTGIEKGFEVYIIPHESDLSKVKNSNNEGIGIIGIACILNLVSGGFKALRLGFTPQCIVLDQCGCSNHWLRKFEMTSINKHRINDILSV